jgi:nucleoid-associated protein YgaU
MAVASGPLSKLSIKNQTSGEVINVLFNPNTYSISKSVTWGPSTSESKEKNATKANSNAPPIEFGGGGNRQLSLELFYDVTEPHNKIEDVRIETDKVVALTRIPNEAKKPEPPVCEISWGKKSLDFPFIGVLTSLTQKFTLFKSNGNPVRATLSCTFMEWLPPEKDKKKTDPEMTTKMVKRGDTLSSIAAEVYQDPKHWRAIAEANNLDDPRRLEVGRRLSIPDLR